MDTSRFLVGSCFFLLCLCGFTSPSSSSAAAAAMVDFCPERCDCAHPQHLLCINRGLRTVPKPAARFSGGARIFSLGGNFITNISASDFTWYSHLIRLNLQYNQVENIHPKAFEGLSNLEELYLGHNLLSSIAAGTFQPLPRLTVFYGNNNGLRKITPGLFSNLESLVKLRLDGNLIEVLQDSVFKSLSSLHYLHLEYNKVQHIHRDAFSKLTSLRFLNLAHNKQSAMQNALTFSHLRALTTLLLSENEIQQVGNHVFQSLNKLSKLSLSNNRISIMGNHTLEGLLSLRELLMDGNQLKEIPSGLLDPLQRIERLDFSHNHISSINPMAFSKLKHLKLLKLNNNFLTSLSGGSFTLNHVLYDLHLHGNNWTCDCGLEDLKRWMTAAHSQGKLLTVIVQCHYPVSLRGIYLDFLNSSQLQPLGNWSHSCESQPRPDESWGRSVLVKVEDGERGAAVKDEERRREEVGMGERNRTESTEGERSRNQKKNGWEDWDETKREKQGKMGIQGDQGGPEVEEAAVGAVAKRPKGRQRSRVITKTTTYPSYSTNVWVSTIPVQLGEKLDHLRSPQEMSLPVVTDPCEFNHHYITNVSVDQVTSRTVSVSWITRDHAVGAKSTHHEVRYRILFDRFGIADRFPRYIYTPRAARTITLRELTPGVTYMVCVEGVVGGSVCNVAPRDHCTGLVTLPEEGSHSGATLTSDLQLVTVATLVGNAVLLLVVSGVWLGRSLRRRLLRRKTSVHVRHMYSTRRAFRPPVTVASVSTDFTSYQSSRPARLTPLEEDLIQFPSDRFLDNCGARRDTDFQRFSD
nr:TLR4 interactor with leucine rich repeats [Nothobranchius furzeri]